MRMLLIWLEVPAAGHKIIVQILFVIFGPWKLYCSHKLLQ
jgi:hypothetical protein